MPFTPVHMGPAMAFKAVAPRSFSILLFGYSQILMDLQPLWVMVQGHGHMHGFTHSYAGASLIGIAALLSGYPLVNGVLRLFAYIQQRMADHISTTKIPTAIPTSISWRVSAITAFVGTYSHVFFDSIMHSDLQPWMPWSVENPFWHQISVINLHLLCLILGIGGSFVWLRRSLKR